MTEILEKSPEELLGIARDSYRVLENVARGLMEQTPAGYEKNMATALTNAQSRLLEGIFWFQQAAATVAMGQAPEGEE